jgi:hypothetical protein
MAWDFSAVQDAVHGLKRPIKALEYFGRYSGSSGRRGRRRRDVSVVIDPKRSLRQLSICAATDAWMLHPITRRGAGGDACPTAAPGDPATGSPR